MKIKLFVISTLLATSMLACNSKNTSDKATDRGTNVNDHSTHDHSQHAVSNAPAEQAEGTTEITFDNLEFDFGTINEGDVVDHTFTFTNTGNVPLIIQNATPSCGCTVPNWSKEPISPGESGKIEVAFDSKGKTDLQNRTVSIIANTEPSITYLRIKGMVISESQALGPVRKN